MQRYTRGTVKFGGANITLWGSTKRRKFVKVDGKLNSKNDICLLRSNILLDCKDGEFFQHGDAAPCQTSRATKRFIVGEDVKN